MHLFSKKVKPVFTEAETNELVNAIRDAELKTSGEVRVFIERHCKYVDAMDRANQIFDGLEMEKTKLRNGVLFYVASLDHQIAIIGDRGIHEKVGKQYWEQTLAKAISIIKKESLALGLCMAIRDVGQALQIHFPFDANLDKNELPDDIVFGN